MPWQTERWIASRCVLRDPNFSLGGGGGIFPESPFKGILCTYAPRLCASQYEFMHKYTTPPLYFVWPKLKCFHHHWHIFLLPQQKFAPKLSVRIKGAESLQQLLALLQEKTPEENAHTSRSSGSTTYSYSRIFGNILIQKFELRTLIGHAVQCA